MQEKKQYLSKVTLQKIKYLGINLTKKVKDFYTENYKTWIKETEDDSKETERYPILLDWKN